jgi:hypothetical protein
MKALGYRIFKNFFRAASLANLITNCTNSTFNTLVKPNLLKIGFTVGLNSFGLVGVTPDQSEITGMSGFNDFNLFYSVNNSLVVGESFGFTSKSKADGVYLSDSSTVGTTLNILGNSKYGYLKTTIFAGLGSTSIAYDVDKYAKRLVDYTTHNYLKSINSPELKEIIAKTNKLSNFSNNFDLNTQSLLREVRQSINRVGILLKDNTTAFIGEELSKIESLQFKSVFSSTNKKTSFTSFI